MTDIAMTAAVRLGAAVDTLAALAAFVRLETEELPADPAVRQLLSRIYSEVVGESELPDPATVVPMVGLARTFLRQAAELVENPGRSGGWDQVDVPLLQSIGRLSMAIGGAIATAGRLLPDLGARLDASGGSFLDVGTGTGWLAIAMARMYPRLAVVGIDIFEPAAALARANVHREDLADRVDIRLLDATQLPANEHFDAIWLSLPFLPQDVVQQALPAAVGALRPGGWILPGTFTGPGDPLSELLTDLRTVRSGGYPWRPAEVIDLLNGAGLTAVQEVPRTWAAPLRLYAGRRS
jgi:SAM-dependent methyltransferase